MLCFTKAHPKKAAAPKKAVAKPKTEKPAATKTKPAAATPKTKAPFDAVKDKLTRCRKVISPLHVMFYESASHSCSSGRCKVADISGSCYSLSMSFPSFAPDSSSFTVPI